MSSRRATGTTKVGIAFLVILLLEAVSDAVIIVFLGGWALLVLPFMIMLQVAFDFILFIVICILAVFGRWGLGWLDEPEILG